MLTISAKLNLITSGFTAGLRGAASSAKQFASTTKGSVAGATQSITGAANSARQLAGNIRQSLSGVSSNAASISSQMSGVSASASASINRASSRARGALEGMSGAVKNFGDNIRNSLNNGFVDPAEKAKVEWKDVARIIQGIIISRVFYDGLHAIQQATSAVWEFAKELEKTEIAFDNLFGDTELTDRFISVLKDAAIDNALFDFSAMEDASKRLLAYGIDYKNLMYVMNGVMAAASVTGDPAKVESISRALGQIYTKGRLVGQEVLQLTEAGVPVYDILNKKLGITSEEMAKIADQGISATDAINALVDGLTEKYGSVLAASKYTMTGMVNNVKDVLLMLGERAIQPVFNFTKAVLYNMQQALEQAYTAMKSGGLGAAFESLVPDDLQDNIRTLIAAFMNIGLHIAKVSKAVKDLAMVMLPGLSAAFSTVTFIIVPILNTLTNLVRLIGQNTTAMRILTFATAAAATGFLLLKARAIGLIILKGLTGIIMGVSKALGVMAAMSSTAARALLLVVGIMLALGTGIAAATGKLDGLVKRLSALSGYNKDMILQPGAGTGNGDIDEFNEKLGDTKNAYDDAADAADKAGKANDKYKRGLLSFDEVYKLNEPSDSGSGGTGGKDGALSDYEGIGLGGINAGALIPDVPSFSDFATDFVNSMRDSIIGKLAVAGLAALLAAKLLKVLNDMKFSELAAGAAAWASRFATLLIKALSGAIIGLAVNSVMSIFTEKLWAALQKRLGLSENAAQMASTGALIGSLLGGAIGMVMGGPGASIIGAAIGHMLGGVVGLLWENIKSFSTTLTAPFAAIAGVIAKAFGGSFGTVFKELVLSSSRGGIVATAKAIIGNIGQVFKAVGAKAITKGGLIGLAIVLLTDVIAGLLWDKLIEKFGLSENASKTAALGQTIGGLVGTAIGGIIGGPAGAIIGGAIGTFAGGLVGVFWEKIKSAFAGVDWGAIGQNIVTGLTGALIGFALGGPIGALIGMAVGYILSMFVQWFQNKISSAGFESVGDWIINGLFVGIKNALSSVGTWIKENIVDPIVNAVKTFFGIASPSTVFMEIGQWLIEGLLKGLALDKIIEWWNTVKSGFTNWKTEVNKTLSSWWSTTRAGFSSWSTKVKGSITTWASNTKDSIGTWVTDTKSTITTWISNTTSDLGTWVTNQKTKFDEWKRGTKAKITSWAADALKAITDWTSNTIGKITTWATNFKDELGAGTKKALSKITNWAKDALDKITDWASDTVNEMGTWGEKFKNKADKKLGSVLRVFTSWISDLKTKVFDKLFGWIESAMTKLTNFISKVKEAAREAANADSAPVNKPSTKGNSKGEGKGKTKAGHALGGIFNREHIARFAEGNKAEAVIPLENASAMQPFVDAISQGILEGIMPAMVQAGGNANNPDNLPPMYVGTLIADERGLKQLYKKFELIKVQENARRGIVTP